MTKKLSRAMETFKTVNGVPTKVITFGKSIDEDLSKVRYLLLVFPGNPGVVEYYREFMLEAFKGLKTKYPSMDIPVWGISHAGHQVDDIDSSLFPSLDENLELYSLEGQFDHKLDFIKKFIPNHVQVIGVGHSIGCKTWLEVIKKIENIEKANCAQVQRCFMLFPTIERMRTTPNGKRLSPVTPYQKAIELLLWPLTLLPTVIHKLFLRFYFTPQTVPQFIEKASLQLFNYEVFRRVLTMARFEMEQVIDLDVTALNTHLHKLFFYFGTTDDWCPLDYVDNMKEQLPEMNFKVCDKGFKHAFVLNSSTEMAAIVCSLISIPNE